MPTQLKSDTARANGAKSQGPKTDEGRAQSSRNAVKHGLSSRKRNPLVLECENDDDFETLHDSQMEIHQPATPAEKDLVDQMIAARWRILRLQSLETDLLDKELRQKQELERQFPNSRHMELSEAYQAQANFSNAMALASRCESRLYRMYHSSYKILRELQAARAKRCFDPNTEAEGDLRSKDCFDPNADAKGDLRAMQSTQPTVPEVTRPEPPLESAAAQPTTPGPAEKMYRNEPRATDAGTPETQPPASEILFSPAI